MRLNPVMVGALSFVGLLVLEGMLRRSLASRRRWVHVGHNVAMSVMNLVMQALMRASPLMAVLATSTFLKSIGLLRHVPGPPWLRDVLGLLCFDFVLYWKHRAEHTIPFLWRFHRVHHSDAEMDVTTAVRHHPLVALFDVPVIWIAWAVFGIPFRALLIGGVVQNFLMFLQHGDFRLPAKLESALGLVLTTPRLHRVHHSDDVRMTNSNYSFLTNIWDRVFGTFCDTQEKIHFGLKEYGDRRWSTVWGMLITPFARTPSAPELAREAGAPESEPHPNEDLEPSIPPPPAE